MKRIFLNQYIISVLSICKVTAHRNPVWEKLMQHWFYVPISRPSSGIPFCLCVHFSQRVNPDKSWMKELLLPGVSFGHFPRHWLAASIEFSCSNHASSFLLLLHLPVSLNVGKGWLEESMRVGQYFYAVLNTERQKGSLVIAKQSAAVWLELIFWILLTALEMQRPLCCFVYNLTALFWGKEWYRGRLQQCFINK